mmetsp:Transcript_85998/g.150011  ORF Transcript_85998/g.150011 Transcript_85998/m.150011 type:complete len:251 (+) Transcript_85998:317-1069(+)
MRTSEPRWRSGVSPGPEGLAFRGARVPKNQEMFHCTSRNGKVIQSGAKKILVGGLGALYRDLGVFGPVRAQNGQKWGNWNSSNPCSAYLSSWLALRSGFMADDPLIAIFYGYGVHLLAFGALPITFRARNLLHRLQQPAMLLLPLPPEGEVPCRRSFFADNKLPVTARALTFMRDLSADAGAVQHPVERHPPGLRQVEAHLLLRWRREEVPQSRVPRLTGDGRLGGHGTVGRLRHAGGYGRLELGQQRRL